MSPLIELRERQRGHPPARLLPPTQQEVQPPLLPTIQRMHRPLSRRLNLRSRKCRHGRPRRVPQTFLLPRLRRTLPRIPRLHRQKVPLPHLQRTLRSVQRSRSCQLGIPQRVPLPTPLIIQRTNRPLSRHLILLRIPRISRLKVPRPHLQRAL